MTQLIDRYRQKLESIAQNYKEKGFEVEVEPSVASLEKLPFDFIRYDYIPDLIATKDDEGAVVEIRDKNQPRNQRMSVSKLQRIAQIIARYDNWHFLIATLDDLDKEIPQYPSALLPSWEILLKRQSRISTFLETEELEPALLYQWSIFEAALRKRASFLSLAVQDFSISSLLNYLYSLGEISVIQIDICQKYLELRNQIAHGFMQDIDPSELGDFCELVQVLLQDWSEEATTV